MRVTCVAIGNMMESSDVCRYRIFYIITNITIRKQCEKTFCETGSNRSGIICSFLQMQPGDPLFFIFVFVSDARSTSH